MTRITEDTQEMVERTVNDAIIAALSEMFPNRFKRVTDIHTNDGKHHWAAEFYKGDGQGYVTFCTINLARAALEASQLAGVVGERDARWQPLKTLPPRHTDLLFASGGRLLGVGRVCYGFHAPIFADSLGNEFHGATHWMLVEPPALSPNQGAKL